MIKKTTAPGASDAAEKAVPVNVLADPVVVKAEEPAKPKRSRKTKAEAEGTAKRGRKPAAKTTAEKKTSTRRSTAKKAEGPKKPTALIIMDGFGHRAEKKGNAIEAANKPNLDRIFSENPLTYIGASGLDVGLPDGQMGNSEVGHTNIGAGRIVYQELTRITKAIQDGIAAVEDLKRQAEAQKREPCPLSGLIIGGYNGGSDWTSGLSANPVVGEAIDMHLSAGGRAVEVCGRGGYPTTAASYEIGMRLMDIGDFFNEDCTRRGGKGLSQVNPTPGNKAGGLTTMTEKNLGSFKTQGHRRILGILDCGDPVPGAGAWGINQAQGANDAYASTTLAMSGCHICLFTTGRGNPIGNACMTTIKITGNPQTATALEDMIDYSAAPMLYGELSLQESGRELYELLLRVANGEETKAEKLGDYSWTTPHGTSYNGDY